MITHVGNYSIRFGALRMDGDNRIHFTGTWAIYDAHDPDQGRLLEASVIERHFLAEDDACEAARQAGMARAKELLDA